MDVKAYIESGILELYIAGLLSDEENQEVYLLSELHPEIKEEILAIENAVQTLSDSLVSSDNMDFAAIKDRLGDTRPVIPIESKPKTTNWIA